MFFSLALSSALAGSPPALDDFVLGEVPPESARAVCVPFGSDRQARCKPQERSLAGMEGNLGLMLCDGKVQQASWVTMYLPKGHSVPGSTNSVDPMSDARAGFDALRKHLIASGWSLSEAGQMGAATVEATRDGVKATVEMGEIPEAPQLPSGSWSAGVVLERVEPCS